MQGLRLSGKIALLLLMLLLLMGASDESARFNFLGHRLMCVCSCNQVLLECNHVGCTRSTGMREELAASMERGENDSLVLQDFVQKYGPTVVLAAATTGFGTAAWITPYAALILGVVAVIFVIRIWNKRPPAIPPSSGGTAVAQLDGLDSYRDQVRKDTEI